MKTLIIGAHPDDPVLGAGGMITKSLAKVAVFSYKEQGFTWLPDYDYKDFPVRNFPEHRQEILDELIKLKKKYNPDLVITHSSFDNHQDHKTLREEVWRAFKDRSIWGFDEEWNCLKFEARCFVKLDKELINHKIQLVEKMKPNDRNYYDPKLIMAKARERGSYINYPFAETFEIIRQVI